MTQLTQARLKEVLDYNPETGIFTWKVATANRTKVGDVAGGLSYNGYIRISIDNKRHLAHRLAHLYMEGYFPEHDVDHIKGIKDDNRWSELRHATKLCNSQNTKVFSTNTSGFPGVYWETNNRNWSAKIQINYKLHHLGNYPTALEAALARYTVEVQCSKWTCNHRSKLVQAIKAAWPNFKPKGE